MSTSPTLIRAHRWQVLQRVFIATLPGYALSASLSSLLAQLLPMADVHAVAIASMLSFTFYTLLILGCFAVRSLRRLWCGMLLGLLMCAGLSHLLAHSTLIQAALGA